MSYIQTEDQFKVHLEKQSDIHQSHFIAPHRTQLTVRVQSTPVEPIMPYTLPTDVHGEPIATRGTQRFTLIQVGQSDRTIQPIVWFTRISCLLVQARLNMIITFAGKHSRDAQSTGCTNTEDVSLLSSGRGCCRYIEDDRVPSQLTLSGCFVGIGNC